MMTDRRTITHEKVARAFAELGIENLANVSEVRLTPDEVIVEYAGIIFGYREDRYILTGDRSKYAEIAEQVANGEPCGE
jgi:hypothetical protein